MKICNEQGHVDKVCKNKSATAEKTISSTKKIEMAEETFFMTLCNTKSEIDNSDWLLDSGCSNHITPTDVVFVDLNKNYLSRVKIRNGIYLNVVGKGTIYIHTSFGAKYISNVLLVPSIT